jgi:hypothetical protein
MLTFTLILSVWTHDNSRADSSLALNMTWAKCNALAYQVEAGLNLDVASVYCELEGVSQ